MDTAVAAGAGAGAVVETDVAARLDRLAWSRFHTLVVAALGITWILDGLEVTLAGAIAGALREDRGMGMGEREIGLAASAYLAGAVLGALVFGWLTDRLGRKRLFFVTLAVYLVATAGTAFTWDVWSFCLMRFLTGAGIGGEYAAINSTIQELVPARYRGWTDLAINGSFWVGAALGAATTLVLLQPEVLPPGIGWRASFLLGSVVGLVILLLRTWLPESPRWLATHGRVAEAEAIVAGIEAAARRDRETGETPRRVRLRPRTHTPLREVWETLVVSHRPRALVALALMVAQAFFYNAIFFTYALVLTRFYGVAAAAVGWYILPFALGNFTGPLLLGRFFDSVGRRPMIAGTYILSGLLLAATSFLFASGALTAWQQTALWMVIFFFASAAASSAYLTVSETFPLEVRALAIAVFYAIGTGFGGVAAPYLFGLLIESGERENVLLGYLVGAALMVAAGIVAAVWGVAAERRALEDVARPLSHVT